MEDYRRLAWKLAPAPWYHVDGSLAWFDDPARAAALREHVQRLQDVGLRGGDAARRAVSWRIWNRVWPSLIPGTPVAWFPDEAWVDAPGVDPPPGGGGAQRGRPRADGTGAGGRRHRHRGGPGLLADARGGQRFPIAAVVNAAGAGRRSRGGAGGTEPAGAGAARPCRARGAAGRWRPPPPPGPNGRYRRATRWTRPRLARSSR